MRYLFYSIQNHNVENMLGFQDDPEVTESNGVQKYHRKIKHILIKISQKKNALYVTCIPNEAITSPKNRFGVFL